jgi:hypothetical protein
MSLAVRADRHPRPVPFPPSPERSRPTVILPKSLTSWYRRSATSSWPAPFSSPVPGSRQPHSGLVARPSGAVALWPCYSEKRAELLPAQSLAVSG